MFRFLRLTGRALALMVTLPFLFFPFSRTLWLAVDLCFRPEEPGDSSKKEWMQGECKA